MKRGTGKSNIDIVKDYLAGTRPFVQVGYTGDKDKYRREGEKWKDVNGIEWKKKDGKAVKLTKTQGDIIRDAIGSGLDCKVCKAKWKWVSEKDKKILTRTGLCLDCLVDYETKLRIFGIYDKYETYRMAMYELGHLRELREKLKETIAYFERTDGNIISMAESEYDDEIVWRNTNKDKILTDAKSDLEKTEDLITKGTKIIKGFKSNYVKSIKKYKLEDILTNK